MIVFSVFGGTGTTIQLCWQGFIGTSAACRLAMVAMGSWLERMERMEACRTGLVADSRLISFRLQKDSLSFWISGLGKDCWSNLFVFFGSSAVQFVFQTQTASEIWDQSHLSQSKQPRPELLHHVAPLSQGWEGLGGLVGPSFPAGNLTRASDPHRDQPPGPQMHRGRDRSSVVQRRR